MKHILIIILLCMTAQISMAQQTDIKSEYQKKVDRMWERHEKRRDRMMKDYEEKRLKFLEEHEAFRKKVMRLWGEKEMIESTKKDWVEYSDDLSSRSIVDFENGDVTVEILADPADDSQKIDEKIEDAVGNLMNSKGKNIDFKSEVIKQENVCKEPIMKGQIDPGQYKDAEKIIKDIDTDNGKKKKISIYLKLIEDHIPKRAEKFKGIIRKHSQNLGINEPLIYAVIEQESYFNPMAKSSANAYGLMQLVPDSGGRDANHYIHGIDKAPEPEYLFDPDNNVELGTGYLKKQMEVYFKDVTDPGCRMLCAIAAYNTGQGNVYYAFTGRRKPDGAFKEINRYSYEQLYEHLKMHLPHSETRDYIQKVTDKMEKYYR